MKIDDIANQITDPTLLTQGYCIVEGYVFSAIRHPANIFDAMLIRNPLSARRFGDKGAISGRSLEEHIQFINKHKIEKATIIAEELSFLPRCPTLKHLNVLPAVTAGNYVDFSPLYDMPSIKSIICATKYGKLDENHSVLDYSKIEGLEYISIGTEYDINFQNIPTLKTLRVFDDKTSNLKDLFCSREIDTLELSACKIQDLDGIEQASKLQCVYLENNRNLQDISSLFNVRDSLKALRIQRCPKITDFSVLNNLISLEYLFLEGSNVLPNLDFVKVLPNLKTLVINMDVESGDLSPCLGLSYVHFGKMRKKYNVKSRELPKGIYYRGNENIDMWRRIQ